MSYEKKSGSNDESFVELFELWVVELFAIVCDEGMRNSKTTNDVLPYKVINLSFDNHGGFLSFQPLGKVVDPCDYKFLLSWCLW